MPASLELAGLGEQSGEGLPGRAAALLVLQHNLWEPQHVRGQAQDTDISKFFSIPLQPAVCPTLEAQKRCQQ